MQNEFSIKKYTVFVIIRQFQIVVRCMLWVLNPHKQSYAEKAYHKVELLKVI